MSSRPLGGIESRTQVHGAAQEDILRASLQRYGIVHRNAEYFTNRDAYAQWYEQALSDLRGRVPCVSEFECMMAIIGYFRDVKNNGS